METGVYQINFKDGRLYRIFYANSTQKRKLMQKANELSDKIDFTKTITNGIHTVKQFNEISKTL